MICVYVLISKRDGKKYIGSTSNLNRRLKEHNLGLVQSTKYRRPLQLVCYREFDNIALARVWEAKYKNSHRQLNRDIKKGLLTKKRDVV